MKYNEKADKFLEEFYASVGATTWEQKLNLLEMKLGRSNFSHNPTAEQKVGCYEYELLEQQGLIELVLA
jgi:hypothetical protein